MESRGAVPCGSLGINDSNTQRSSQQKWTRQRGKQGAASSAASAGTQIHIHSTEEGEGSGEEPVVPRGPEWVDEHVRRPVLVRIVIEEAGSAIFPIPTVLGSHHLFGYVHLRIPTTARVSSLAPLDVRAVELEPFLIPLPLEEN